MNAPEIRSVIKSSGFTAGEFTTIICNIALGTFPASAGFSVTNLNVFDTNLAAVTGLTATLTATINVAGWNEVCMKLEQERNKNGNKSRPGYRRTGW